MAIPSFKRWEELNENGSITIDPFVNDFMDDVENLEGVYFEDWWCASDENLWSAFSPSSRDLNLIKNAEKEESEQRNSQNKQITPFYLVELKLQHENVTFFGIVGINMKTRKWFIKTQSSSLSNFENEIEELLQSLLRKHHRTTYTSRKYGLS